MSFKQTLLDTICNKLFILLMQFGKIMFGIM